MKIGHREIVFSEIFLIPKGEVVSGPMQLGSKSVLLIIKFKEATSEYATGTIRWDFAGDGNSLTLEFYGTYSALPSSTPDLLHVANMDDKPLRLSAVYYGTDHLCVMHIQLLKDA